MSIERKREGEASAAAPPRDHARSEKNTVVTVSLPEELRAQIETFCAQHGYSTSGFFRAAAQDRLERETLIQRLLAEHDRKQIERSAAGKVRPPIAQLAKTRPATVRISGARRTSIASTSAKSRG